MLSKDAISCSEARYPTDLWLIALALPSTPASLSADIRVIAGVYAYDSRLKRWMERFHWVAAKYLENYLSWRRWLERWGEHNSPIVELQVALGRENQFQLLTQT